MKSKRYAVVNEGQCVACGACEKACPMEAIRVYKGCFARVDTEKCVGCGKCEKACPANSICIESRAEA